MNSLKFLLSISFLLIFSALLIMSCSQETKKVNNTANNSPKESVAKNVAADNQDYDNFLTANDIEQVSGLKGVKLIPRNPKIGAGGDLNFATNDDKLIVMVQIVDQNNFGAYKKYFFKSDIKRLGDQAMIGATIPNLAENLVAFTKGSKCIALTVFINSEHMNKNMLSIDQTTELAKTIASRM